jgi:hypothetical protein
MILDEDRAVEMRATKVQVIADDASYRSTTFQHIADGDLWSGKIHPQILSQLETEPR